MYVKRSPGKTKIGRYKPDPQVHENDIEFDSVTIGMLAASNALFCGNKENFI